MGSYLHQTLKVDEVWFLLSVNPKKDPNQYAPAVHRMEMGRLMARHYPDTPFVMSDIQDRLDTHITWKVLRELKNRFPDYAFIWTMGADNLCGRNPDGTDNRSSFDKWEHYEDIIENFPIAVFNRPPYTETARSGSIARTYAHLMVDDPHLLSAGKPGWCFLDNPPIDMSSSDLKTRLRRGETTFEGPFQDIADYARAHGLYGIPALSPNCHLSPHR